MGAMGGGNVIGQHYSMKMLRITALDGEARIAEYVVGTAPEDVVYQVLVCLTINKLPEKFHEAAMLLHAAVSGEVMARIPGLGSVRLLEDGCLYFRFYD